jgi:GNAT superfamily N-acetyltransferase
MKNLVIRKGNINDLGDILLLSDGLTLTDLPYDKKVDINWAHTNEGKKYYEDKIKGILGICFVAEVDNKIIGYITACEKEVPSYRLVKVAELENIFVKAEYRSKGIGKKLMDKFINWAKELKADKVAVNVFALNDKAIGFYKREGFDPQDLTLEKYLK